MSAEQVSPAEAYSRFRERRSSPQLAAFADGYGFAFDDYQSEACAHVEAGAGVLVAAPTGAGKTIVGEFAVYLALQQGRKAFYTTPIKALSNQKYADLARRHGAANVGLLTGDSSVNSEAPVVVMTTEVLRNMIYAGSRTLDNLGYVVMDEVHYLADRFRGGVWEEVIIGLAESVQVVALSATVSNAEEFGEWLAAVRGEMEVVVSERRPVPLYQHVLVGRNLYDLFADVAPTARPDAPPGHGEVNPALLKVAREESRFVRDDSRRPRGRGGRGKRNVSYGSGAYGGASQGRDGSDRPRSLAAPSRREMVEQLDRAALLPAIVFIFSRNGCDAAVRQLLGSGITLTRPEEQSEIAGVLSHHLGGLDEADLRALDYPRFAEALTRGVAAHHAGMLPAFKGCVEECFVRGLTKVVFATETLALGINMPARSVVLEKLVKYNGETHADITPGEYTQLTGRAGRRGIDVEGHAVVLWQPGLDPRAVAGLASRRTYPLRSSFAPTYNMAVNLVGSVGRARARALLEQSFAQFQSDRSVVGVARTVARNTEAITETWADAACDRGDFEAYARRRAAIADLEADAARERKADRRAESVQVLVTFKPGDIVKVPAGRSQGWVVVLDPGVHEGGSDESPRPLVMTEDRQVRRLALVDFPAPPVVAGRMRVPKHFSPKEPASRRNLAAAFRSRLAEIDLGAPALRRPPADAEVAARVEQLRDEQRRDPVHSCPDREQHARTAERALRLERENVRLESRASTRTHTIATSFDRICLVLQSLGYLTGDTAHGPRGEVSDAGRMLARIYGELDLVAAECIRAGVFDGLTVPQLAAVLSSLVFEARRSDDQARRPRMPDAASSAAVDEVRRVWRQVSFVERDARLPRSGEPEIGFAEVAYGWAAGRSLAAVVEQTDLTAGDFVRWVRQVIDFAGQVADAAGAGPLRETAHALVRSMRRGVVTFEAEEVETDET
ncbi:DEAD/DEAH box helicase [Microlunatus flavus]|uniref:ATP-dependent RNA helicase HelY n=1 Tax=Microlunatus flavus TaxID=1036181 RepID=A0A1H9MSB5_9ACTN|nr:DEAD/DEAH box helicase [Microlunatus flavus]SER26606.1 ATP-dependent RNA helicase HelY [Microlunatus flavus]